MNFATWKNKLFQDGPVILVFVILILVFLPTFTAKFGIIDDKNIIYYSKFFPSTSYPIGTTDHFSATFNMEPQLQMSLQGLYRWIRFYAFSPVVGQFQPLYFIPHFLEVYLEGNRPELWHIVRVAMGLFTAGFVYFLLRFLLNPWLSALCCLYFFSGMHSTLWINVTLAETYGYLVFFPGFYLLFLSFFRLRGERQTQLSQLGLILISLCGWIKTSLVPLLPGTYFFCFFLMPFLKFYPKPQPVLGRRHPWVTFLLLVNFFLQLVAALLILKDGSNQWVASNWSTRWTQINADTWQVLKLLFWPIPILVVGSLFQSYNRIPLLLSILFSQFVFWFLPQWIIYGEVLSYQGRYLTPANLFPFFSIVLTLAVLNRSANPRNPTALMISLFVGAFSLYWMHWTFQRSTFEANASRSLQKEINEILVLKKRFPDSPIVFCSNLWNREPLQSVSVYLKSYLQNGEKFFLKLDKKDGWRENLLLQDSAKAVIAVSELGDDDFHPLSRLPEPNPSAIGVYFSGAKENCFYSKQVQISELFQ